MAIDRRNFLRGVAAAGGAFALRGFAPLAARASRRFPAGVWGGNVPTWCHDLVRDGGRIPRVAPSRSVEFLILGGGLAGLSAAYQLRDASVLLLEHLDRVGGHCVRDRWNDIWYAGASAYFVEPEPPLDELYAELGFPLTKIAEPADSAILGWNPVVDVFGAGLDKLPYPDAVRRDFARAKADFAAILESDDCPVMPLADTTEASKKYDTMTFADWMLKEQKYHPAVKAYVDLYCRSAFGAPGSEHLSAFAGLNFYVSEFSDRYTFPGGNALAAELLRDAIHAAGAGRILAGTTAVEVEDKGGKVIVTAIDADGEAIAIEAGAVLMACPKYVAKHVVKGLPKDQVAAMDGLTYGSYVVANVLCTSAVTDGSYDTWTDVAPFTDVLLADWITRGPGQEATSKHQVLTVYYPTGYEIDSLLDDGAYDRYRDTVVRHLDYLYPGAEAKIEDVKLYRWGHALCHAKPGWYTGTSPLASRPFGRVLFAHSDNQGLPAFEAALIEGMSAAAQARELVAAR